MAALIVAFMLFGLLDSVSATFSQNNSGEATRLIVTSRRFVNGGLPLSISSTLERLGIDKSDIAWSNWVGGHYQNPRSNIVNVAISSNYLKLYSEFIVLPSTLRRFSETKNGVIVGKKLAEKYNWRIGQQIYLSDVPYQSRSSADLSWSYQIVGIFTVRRASLLPLETFFFSRWDYFNDNALYADSHVGWFIVRLDNFKNADRLSTAIDTATENSNNPTKTETELEFQKQMANRISNAGAVASDLMILTVLFIFVLTSKVMSHGVKECWGELGVMKAIGFSRWTVFSMLVLNGLIFVSMAGAVGMFAAVCITRLVDLSTITGFISRPISLETWVHASYIAAGVGISVILVPAVRSARASPTKLLRG